MAHYIATPDGVYEAGDLVRRLENLTRIARRVSALADLDPVTRMEIDAALASDDERAAERIAARRDGGGR